MLADLRIVDLTRLLPGPYATWLLAGMGADVVKVEQPGLGDYIRWNWPRRHGTSTVFHLLNRAKRLIAIDLKQPEGRAALLDLASRADAVIEGFRPGVLQRLGLSWETLHWANPKLVLCSLSGFGQESPYSRRVGHDINYLSLAGLEDGLRSADGTPIAARFQIADMAGGALSAVVGLLAAIHEAGQSGSGRHVDSAMTDAVFPFQALRLAEELIPGDARGDSWQTEAGSDHELGSYQTADGEYISLDPYELAFKSKLWEIVEDMGLARRPRDNASREEVRATLARAVRMLSRQRWVELLSEEQVCFAPVHRLEDLPSDPHVAFRGLLGNAMDASVPSPSLGFPLKFDPPLQTREAQDWRLGAHTVEVLTELGWSREGIAAARASGAIEAVDS